MTPMKVSTNNSPASPIFWPAHLSTNHSLCSQKCFTLHIAGTADTRHLGTEILWKKMPNQKKQVSLF